MLQAALSLTSLWLHMKVTHTHTHTHTYTYSCSGCDLLHMLKTSSFDRPKDSPPLKVLFVRWCVISNVSRVCNVCNVRRNREDTGLLSVRVLKEVHKET